MAAGPWRGQEGIRITMTDRNEARAFRGIMDSAAEIHESGTGPVRPEKSGRRLRASGIRGKLTILLLAFGLVPAFVLFGILYSKEDGVRQALTSRVAVTATAVNDVIDRNLFERYGDVQAFALNEAAKNSGNWGVRGEKNPLVRTMNGYMTGYGIYKLMLLVGLDGQVLAVNSRDAKGGPLDSEKIYAGNFKDAPWFRDAVEGRFLNGKNGFTGTAVSQPHREDIVAGLYGSDGYVLTFSAPVKDAVGKTVAVWVNFADFGLVEEIVSKFYEGFAKDGRAYAEFSVLDPEGRVIVDYDPTAQNFKDFADYKRNFDVIGKLNLVKVGVGAAARAVKGESGAEVAVHARKKVEQAAGFAKSAGVYDYPGLGWSVLVRVPASQSFALWNDLILDMIIALAVSAALIAASGLFVGSGIARPIRTLSGCMLRLADGDKSVEISGGARKDELGDMARAVQVFKDSMIETERLQVQQREAERKAQEEEIRRADEKRAAEAKLDEDRRAAEARAEEARKRGMLEMADAFEASVMKVVDQLSASTDQMQETVRSVSASADRTSEQATAVAAASEQASANVQTIATATEELSSSIQEIGRQVGHSTQISQQAVGEAEHTNAQVEGLAEAAQKIGDVVSLINDIASQTNLLALNATIEAARAGEAGKGFAVVASEVKSLATQTSKATEEITSQISAIQGATTDAVQAIRGIGSTIGQVGEIATAVAAAVEEQGAATAEIANNVQQAAAGTQEVSGKISEVTRAASESRSASNKMREAADSVAEQGSVLRREVEKFLATIRAA
jgi:methyl-accepting chemotaxis protein